MGELNTAIRHQQPERVVLAILRDSVRLFALTRTPGVQRHADLPLAVPQDLSDLPELDHASVRAGRS